MWLCCSSADMHTIIIGAAAEKFARFPTQCKEASHVGPARWPQAGVHMRSAPRHTNGGVPPSASQPTLRPSSFIHQSASCYALHICARRCWPWPVHGCPRAPLRRQAGGKGGGGHPQSRGLAACRGSSLLARSRGIGKRSEGGRPRCGAVCCDAQQQGHVACELEVTNPNQPPQFRTSPHPASPSSSSPAKPRHLPPDPFSCKHGGAFRLLLVFLSLRTADGGCGGEGRAPGSPRTASTFREVASPALPGSWRSALLHVDEYCV